MTPTEIGRLLEGIEKSTIVSKAACAETIRVLREQQSGARRIPRYLNVPVGHKTGDFRRSSTTTSASLMPKSGAN